MAKYFTKAPMFILLIFVYTPTYLPICLVLPDEMCTSVTCCGVFCSPVLPWTGLSLDA